MRGRRFPLIALHSVTHDPLGRWTPPVSPSTTKAIRRRPYSIRVIQALLFCYVSFVFFGRSSKVETLWWLLARLTIGLRRSIPADPNWRWGGSGTKPGSGKLDRDPPSAPQRDHEDEAEAEAGCGSSDVHAGSTSFVLACPPAVEAECYRGYLMCPLHARLRNVTVPVRVVRAPGCVVVDGCQGAEDDANFGFDQSPTDPHLYRAFGSAASDFVLHKPYTHFFPMMDPQMVADHVRSMIDGLALPDTSLSAKL